MTHGDKGWYIDERGYDKDAILQRAQQLLQRIDHFQPAAGPPAAGWALLSQSRDQGTPGQSIPRLPRLCNACLAHIPI